MFANAVDKVGIPTLFGKWVALPLCEENELICVLSARA